jgi:superfamily I DNA/RNA helicase
MVYHLHRELSESQSLASDHQKRSHLFLEGPAGCGKTTAGVERLARLLDAGVPGQQILLLTPTRALAEPYQQLLRLPGLVPGGAVATATIGGLARRMCELFWPLVAQSAGFARPDLPPTFLTLETAQYYMAHLVRPLLDEGYFDSVVINRNRLYSQIIDNLNKAAMAGYPHGEIGERLRAAWVGEQAQLRIYADAQACASRFREFCLAHNLLDFSLQVELFTRHLWPDPICRGYLQRNYRHLIADNIEENPPVAHDLLAEWLPDFESALLIYDHAAGYRLFLGADPGRAYELRELCPTRLVLEHSFVSATPLQTLGERLQRAVSGEPALTQRSGDDGNVLNALAFQQERFYPEMLDWVANQISDLVHGAGTPPGEIAVLAPFVSDALRFSLTQRLERRGIPVHSHRPSRALRAEPAARALLTLAALAHPEWGLRPARADYTQALQQAIAGLDPVRAQLLAEITYRLREGAPQLTSFDSIVPAMQSRITFNVGERYERLRGWLDAYTSSPPEALDHFLARLFGELLSQPGFGFHQDFQGGRVAATLIESIQKFRWAATDLPEDPDRPLGRTYLLMVAEGVIAASYLESWRTPPAEAVFLAPAYTFLMQNRPVDHQFWLDVGARSWFERIAQPLTHPYVLSRNWPPGRQWTQADEETTSRDTLQGLALGLVRRCRERVYLGISQLNEQGYESRGPLLRAFDLVVREAT